MQLLREAPPQLRVLHADLTATPQLALSMLRNEPPFEALRLRFLEINNMDMLDDDGVIIVNPDVVNNMLAIATAMRGHASLRELSLVAVSLQTLAVLDAVAAAATACRLPSLVFDRCSLSPASVPALVRVLRAGALTSLKVSVNGQALLDAASGVQLADAVAAHRTLLKLAFVDSQFWLDAAAAAAIMHAVTGHPSLQILHLGRNLPPDVAAAGAALGALVAADAPALRKLSFCHSARLGDAGMLPVLDALARNTHLRELDCHNVGMSDQFAQDIFLPAMRANTGLRKLAASEFWLLSGMMRRRLRCWRRRRWLLREATLLLPREFETSLHVVGGWV